MSERFANIERQVDEAHRFLKVDAVRPRVGIILGSGLGEIADDIVVHRVEPFAKIPHFSRPTADGHAGLWTTGTLANQPCVVMQGRLHIYEGNTPQACTLPVRVMQRLGVELLIVSNASGGLNPQYRSGDVMIVEDHINLMFRNPLIGQRHGGLWNRENSIVDMSAPYDAVLIDKVVAIARRLNLSVHRGVYAALTGPTYETRAEYRMLRRLGADVIGMSTIPEVLVGVSLGMRLLALSAVTNECRPDELSKTEHAHVVATAGRAAPKMRALIQALLAEGLR